VVIACMVPAIAFMPRVVTATVSARCVGRPVILLHPLQWLRDLLARAYNGMISARRASHRLVHEARVAAAACSRAVSPCGESCAQERNPTYDNAQTRETCAPP